HGCTQPSNVTPSSLVKPILLRGGILAPQTCSAPATFTCERRGSLRRFRWKPSPPARGGATLPAEKTVPAEKQRIGWPWLSDAPQVTKSTGDLPDVCLVRDRLDVLAEQVLPEVAVEVAPDRVDVVGVVLGVVVLDEERRPLHAVVVPLPHFEVARPGE